ncbi:MAG: hypothetical protein AAGA77_01125 [Bacteroidota bacterium]
MNNKEFDDIIKKKLESLNTEGVDDAWDLFKEKWNNESSGLKNNDDLSEEDQHLDEKIKTDMQKLRIPFNSQHWIILKEQLELEALFKKKLFVAKSVELIVLAFLVLGILNLWPIQNSIYQIPVHDNPMVASVPVDKETAEIYEAREEIRTAKQTKRNKQILNSTKRFAQRSIVSIEKLSSSISSVITPNSEKTIETPVLKEEDKRVKNTPNEIKPNTIFPFLDILDSTSKAGTDREVALKREDKEMASLLPIDINQFDLPKRPTGYPDMVLPLKAKKDKENTYVSFAVGPKMNLINSPFDPVYKLDPYNIINTNFNISAKVHKEIGPMEIYAGLGYTNTSYAPLLVPELYESNEEEFSVVQLENIEFKTFNVPVGIHYNLFGSRNFQVYATAGVDLNIIAYSDYKIVNEPVGSSGPPSNNPAPAPQPGNEGNESNEVEVNSNADLSLKEFDLGILDGGSLRNNLYATANVGFGLNWNFSPRSGLFIEPRYSHFITSQGLGPNEDRLHGISVDLGFKYMLN